jgi:hypothetical protein
MARKENALDLGKFIDKSVRVKLTGGREGMTLCCLGGKLVINEHSSCRLYGLRAWRRLRRQCVG